MPMPASAAAYRASESVPTIGVSTSPPTVAPPRPMPSIVSPTNAAMPSSTAMPPDPSQRRRDRGVASTISVRPDDSSEAQVPTSVAAASPDRIRPNSMNTSCRNAPGLFRSMSGNTWLMSWVNAGDSPICSTNDFADEPITSPKTPRPMPQARAVGSSSAKVRPVGPRRPFSARGRLGVGIVLVWPMSRRTNASMPMARSTTVTAATSSSEAQSYAPASGRWLVVQPNQVRFANGASSGIAVW